MGAEVIRSLAGMKIPVRAADLYPEKILESFGDGVQAVRFDFSDPETLPIRSKVSARYS